MKSYYPFLEGKTVAKLYNQYGKGTGKTLTMIELFPNDRKFNLICTDEIAQKLLDGIQEIRPDISSTLIGIEKVNTISELMAAFEKIDDSMKDFTYIDNSVFDAIYFELLDILYYTPQQEQVYSDSSKKWNSCLDCKFGETTSNKHSSTFCTRRASGDYGKLLTINERNKEGINFCGLEGKFWQAKEKA